MKRTINEQEFSYLCAEACADRDFTWRSHSELPREDALWWDIFRRLCHYLGQPPVLVNNSREASYAEACRYNILRVVMNRREGDFNALQIAYNHVREALKSVTV